MFQRLSNRFYSLTVLIAIAAGVPTAAQAVERLADPNVRQTTDTQPTQSSAPAQGTTVATPVAATQQAANNAVAKSVFDLTQKQGEHPLAPVLRVLKSTAETIDRDVHDYNCTLVKQERVDGELGDKQFILLKVMHQPFSVYMSFLKPYAGREVVYVEGQNSGKLIVLEAGMKRMLGKMPLDPNGSLAMSGQKHPITDVGFRNLCTKLGKMWEAETKFAECDVTTDPNTHIANRSTTMIQVVHPVPRQDFRFHAARLFLDNELKVPIHFDAYSWPEQEGGEPLLEESYTYTNLKLNNGYTAREFDAANNPNIFK
ncbi:MAG TPA: DUF1571 domain-containing protein [Lacipirellulaceae bacterium]|nr:DUF1571 domain-containing protein [Lacipirellulaceae bacterium]